MEENKQAQEQKADSEQLYPVTVDGQQLELTLEQLIAAAEQGLSQANAAAAAASGPAPNSAPTGAPAAPAQPPQAEDREVYRLFLDEYPDVQPEEIPPEVWDAANQSGDLLGAYRIYEIKRLREELEECRKNADNRKLDVGSARSDGEAAITDPIILALMGK